MAKASYKDAKGRLRWHRNDEIALTVKQLGEFLIIGGYPEDHAARYAQIAHAISRWPDKVDDLAAENKLDSLPGVGGVITGYLDEIIRTGTTSKFKDDQYGPPPPKSVLELTAIDRVGAKTAKMMYQDLGIDGLKALKKALKNDTLKGVKGIGPKMLRTLKEHCQV
ncbi:MAG: hypothetical protein KTR32_24295 [Granulosicoccus sp.]|nr:hypothetical protein [Granulosicoccus sp.]